jgi:hypothetical protein
MKRFVLSAALATAIIALSAPTIAAEEHSHGASAEAPAHAITLDNGRRWQTDAPLREGMAEIRSALVKKHPEVGARDTSAAEYAALGATIEKNVGSIVANCKLSPEADRNLHVVVAELVSAADDLQGKSRAKPAEGLHKAVRAVNLYGRYFDHPGWKPIA